VIVDKKILTRPFPPELVRHRQGQGGKQLSYVPTFAVVERLNEGCTEWSFEIVKHELVGDEMIVIGKLAADGVVKMAFGGATVSRSREGFVVDLGDTAKAAASDALKKAASLLGVGLELHRGGAPATVTTSAANETKAQAPAAPAVGDRITTKQLAAIQSVTRKQDIGRDDLAAMLGERFSKGELHALTKREASSFLSELIGSNGSGAHA
jgi:hypothetical protein